MIPFKVRSGFSCKGIRFYQVVALVILFLFAVQITGFSQCTLLDEPFNSDPLLSNMNEDGKWYPDRYRPAAFVSDNARLKISIHESDGAQNRPGGFGSQFYNTQGRKFNQCGGCVTISKARLYIPADWATENRRSDMWATAFNAANAISFYPIIGFRNINGASPNFSYWNGAGWVDLGAPSAYDTWYALEFRLVGANIEYLIDNTLVGTVAANNSVYFGDIIMQAYNFNDNTLPPGQYDPNSTYDAFWDDLITLGTGGKVVTNTNTGLKYCSIQGAIDNVLTLNGHTLTIAAATYNERVTVSKQLTLDGAAEATTILDGAGLAGFGSGIRLNNGIANVTIKDLTIRNYAGNGPNSNAGIFGVGGNNNLTVEHVTIKDNVGGCGFYANGPINQVSLDDLDVSGHTAVSGAARGIVIWNGHKSNISITNCDVYNNNCCGIELQDGSASAVTMSNNNVHDNWDSGMSAVGLDGTTGSNTISNNTVTNNGRFGIEIKNPNGNGSNITVSGNTVSLTGSFAAARPSEERDLAGIAAFRRGVLGSNVDVPMGVSITGNTVSGYVQDNPMSVSEGFGIVVEGTDHTVTGNTVTGNDVGIQQQAGHLPYPGDGDQNDLADQYFGRGNSPRTCGNTVSGNTLSGNTVNTRNVGIGGGIVTNTNTMEEFCSIQAAIDDANTANGHVIEVSAGTYAENITLNKRLELRGNNYGIDPNTGMRVAESIIVPATSDPDPNSPTAVNILYMNAAATGSIIDGFTFDGDNPKLTSGVVINGADIDAIEALSAYDGTGDLTVKNNIVKNLSYAGMDFYNYTSGGAVTSNNVITNNKFDNIQPNTFGIGILIYNNFYARIEDNVMTRVRIGVQTGNFYLANTGSTQSISDNTIESSRLGLFYNLMYGSASSFTVQNNVFTTYTGSTNNEGMLISSIGGAVTVAINNNNIDGAKAGIDFWNCTATTPVTMTGGQITNCQYGVFANNYDGYSSNGNTGTVAISGVSISGSTIAAVYVKDNPLNSNNADITLIIKDDCSLVGTGQLLKGILVEGTDAHAIVQDNDASINGFAIGIDVDGGTAIITNNHIYDNGIGVRFINGGNGTVNNENNFDGGPDPDNGKDIQATASAGSVLASPDNSFAGDLFGIENLSATTINATLNYWESTSGPGPIGPGTGAPVTTKVNYCPWLVGLPPGGATASSVQNTTTFEYFCTIQAAIDDPQTLNGHTLAIGAGIYNERVTVSKQLTLDGAAEATTILDGAGLAGFGSGIR
ncbi:MAG TPA: right-handed parallel beta-helix repeat-containing protein, partial [Saprospiraceae bacterium]|nr:right-handed parallel beta-helix repeat-containing protein [Saprospiraceae bacterium]